MPPGAQEGHTGVQNAKQGRSRPRLCGGPFLLDLCKFQLLQKFFLPIPRHLVDLRDRVAQIAVTMAPTLPTDRGFLRLNQTFVYQQSDVLLNGFSAHAYRSPDGGVGSNYPWAL